MAEDAPIANDVPPRSEPRSILAVVAIAFAVLNLGANAFVAIKVIRLQQAEAHTANESGAEGKAIGKPTVMLDPFLVNLNETETAHYLKVTIEVEVANAEAVEVIAHAKPAVRDEILRYISGLRVADTMGEDGKMKMQGDLVARLDKLLGGGQRVQHLFFNEFMVQ